MTVSCLTDIHLQPRQNLERHREGPKKQKKDHKIGNVKKTRRQRNDYLSER